MKILTPVDQSRRDGIVLPYSVSMAKVVRGSVVLVHVVPLTRSLVPSAVRQAEAYVAAVEPGLRESGVDVESFVRRGDPGPVIADLAAKLDVGMIVMATRGRGNLGKFVLGSVADAVLANSQKPVLLLSEATNGASCDEETRLQSSYLAAVIWHRQAKGLCTKDEAKKQLNRLAASGLDADVLYSTYQAQDEQGILLGWLDIDFQMDTLRKFLPEEVAALVSEEIPRFPRARAA